MTGSQGKHVFAVLIDNPLSSLELYCELYCEPIKIYKSLAAVDRPVHGTGL